MTSDSEFDESLARSFVGRYVLVGVTFEDSTGQFQRQEQFHGIVLSADARAGIALGLRGTRNGETQWLPPATRPFEAAAKGSYTLRSTGEVVVDPDFTCEWLVKQSDANASSS